MRDDIKRTVNALPPATGSDSGQVSPLAARLQQHLGDSHEGRGAGLMRCFFGFLFEVSVCQSICVVRGWSLYVGDVLCRQIST